MILLRAAFDAEFVQSCVVTLDPVAGACRERFRAALRAARAEDGSGRRRRGRCGLRAAGRRGDRYRRGGGPGILAGAAALPAQPRCRSSRRGGASGRRARPVRRAGAPCPRRRRDERCRAGRLAAASPLPAPSLLPPPRILAKYRELPRSLRRVDHGRSEKENLAVAPQYAPLASRAARAGLCRVPELRRTEAAASSVRVMRLLRRARGGAGRAGPTA